MARDDVQLKIEWASRHIDEFHTVLRAFIDCNPYVVDTKRNPETRRLIYYIVRATPVPDELALIAGDVLQNLRTALDYLACSLVPAAGITKETAFPIFDDAAKYNSGSSGKVKGMRREAIDLIDSIKPYKGGDDVLWRLHRLNNVDKHRLLFTVGAAFRSVDLGPSLRNLLQREWSKTSDLKLPDFPLELAPTDRLFPLKAGDELFIDLPDAEVAKNMKFTFDVAINEPGVCEGEPLTLVLRASLDRVRHIVEQFAAIR